MNRQHMLKIASEFSGANSRNNFEALRDSLLPYLESVNSPKSLAVAIALQQDCNALTQLKINPYDYCENRFSQSSRERYSAHSFKHDYQSLSVLSKFENLPLDLDPQKEAEKGFIHSEVGCAQVNNCFINREGLLWESPVLASVFYSAKRKIARWLGNVPELRNIPMRFGPGQNVGLSNNKTSLNDKLRSIPSIAEELEAILPEVLNECPSWKESLYIQDSEGSDVIPYDVVPGSRLGFVPKNAKTHRAICTEPTVNSFLQLGIGTIMRRKLRHVGCNLDSQERNQQLALEGSLTDKLSTIDLKAASDTISYMLVAELLPQPWFDLLDLARSHSFTYQDRAYSFEKFSSMGNGFTFELESMIFYALTLATVENCSIKPSQRVNPLGSEREKVSVYGDDIICPTYAVPLLEFVLTFAGFTINQDKSFTHGPFRESCGEDFFGGSPVRPVFLKEDNTSNEKLISFCNHVFRRNRYREDDAYNALYDGVKGLIPKVLYALEGPDGYGDGHFVKHIADRLVPGNRHHSRRKKQHEGVPYWTVSTTAIPHPTMHHSVYPTALFLAGANAEATGSGRFQGILLNHRRKSVRYVVKCQYHPWC